MNDGKVSLRGLFFREHIEKYDTLNTILKHKRELNTQWQWNNHFYQYY